MPERMLESPQEPPMMTADQPAEDARPVPPGEEGVLGEWFDDPDVPEEVQALRAWVAGLSNELAQARRERDEVQQALYAALAEVAQLRGVIAQADVGLLPPSVLALPTSTPPRFSESPGSTAPAPAAASARPPARADDEPPSRAQDVLPHDDTEITAEMIDAWASEAAVPSSGATARPGRQVAEAPPSAETGNAAPATLPRAATAADAAERSDLSARLLLPDRDAAQTGARDGSRRRQVIAGSVLLLVLLAAAAFVIGPRLTP
jgi:hypothetical protein